MLRRLDMINTFSDLSHYIMSAIAGILGSIFGYFMPVVDVVSLVFAFFILDMVIGYWAARKTRGEKFSTPKVWNTTVPRLLLSIIIILASFAWDEVFSQTVIQTHRSIGWFISGILLYSIIVNGYKITHWVMFSGVADIIKDKLNIKEQDKKNKKESNEEM